MSDKPTEPTTSQKDDISDATSSATEPSTATQREQQTTSTSPVAAVIWDFDWSLVNENSDTWIFRSLGAQETQRIMKDRAVQWTKRCDLAVLQSQLNENHCLHAIAEAFRELPCFVENIEAIRLLHSAGVKQYIVSDANTMFIQSFLRNHPSGTLEQCFSKIISNKATLQPRKEAEATLRQYREQTEFGGEQLADCKPEDSCDKKECTNGLVMRISAYHSHDCEICPVNMCKGTILRRELFADTPGEHYVSWPERKILYVGDGGGDYCAALALRAHDTLLVRRGFRLEKVLVRKRLENEDEKGTQPSCDVRFWDDGAHLKRHILGFLAGEANAPQQNDQVNTAAI